MKNPKHFDEVASNAIGFLGRSVDELLDERLKFSAVFFYQAVELFVKARLLYEHWSLIVSDPAKACLQAFEKGDFRSLTLDQAVERLRSIAQDDISSAKKVFEPVRKRRNKIIHFYAPEIPDESTSHSHGKSKKSIEPFDQAPDEIVEVVREQCVAWYELHSLLTSRWKKYFQAYQGKIELLAGHMMELRPYLQVRYDQVKPKIDKLIANGEQITNCPACGFEAKQDSEIFLGMTHSRCLVCHRYDRSFRFPCPENQCGGEVVVLDDGGGGECTHCEDYLSLDDVIRTFEPITHPGDIGERYRAYCSECNSFEAIDGTVVFVGDLGRYICLSCLNCFEQDEVSKCEWCGQCTTGDTEDSFMVGCMCCDGRLGHEMDR